MKAVILAGGKGTRLSEETQAKPKPLVEAGGKPLIWHIMQNYFLHGIDEFIILAGYKGQLIREYFNNFWLHQSDITFDLGSPKHEVIRSKKVPWKVTVLDTGLESGTGTRLRYLQELITEDFLLTYGDGVADVNIPAAIAQHARTGKIATLTAVQPPGRYGALELDEVSVTAFCEKPEGEGGWINGGFFVVSPEAIALIEGDQTSWEGRVLPILAARNSLGAYFHKGFWQPMDTLREKNHLEDLWASGRAPWKIWT